jgi:hypothetical protein
MIVLATAMFLGMVAVCRLFRTEEGVKIEL